jgi:hypothetical protein
MDARQATSKLPCGRWLCGCARHHRRPVRRRLGAEQRHHHRPHRRSGTEAQWEDYVGALSYRFTEEDEALVDSLVPPGHPSTPGYNDPAYPLEGRIPPAASRRG